MSETYSADPARTDEDKLVNLDSAIRDQVPSWVAYSGYFEVQHVSSSGVTFQNAEAIPIGSPEISYANTWYIGSTTLVNSSDVEQTLSTQSFSQAINETLSTSVTRGLSATATVGASYTYSGFAVNTTLSTTVNFSKTETQTSSVTQTYTAPSQNIKVPAHSKADVAVVLQQARATGRLALNTDLGGNATFDVYRPSRHHFDVPIYGILGPLRYGGIKYKVHPPPLPTGITVDDATQTVKFDGIASYTANYGTTMSVQVAITPYGVGLAPAPSQAPSTYEYKIFPEVDTERVNPLEI